jgi:recombination protein RecT
MTQHAMTKSTDKNKNTDVFKRSAEIIHKKMFQDASQQGLIALLGSEARARRFCKIAYGAISRNPDLLMCTHSSLFRGVSEAAQFRLDLNGVLGESYLVPYKNKNGVKEAQFQIGYRGYSKLICRSGKVRNVSAGHVYDCDRFEVEFGSNEKLIHVPSLDRPKDAKIVASYAVAHFVSGGCAFVVLGAQEIEQARAASASIRSGRQSPWDTNKGAMCEKSAINKLAKRLPLSDDEDCAIALDDLRERGAAQISAETSPADALMLPEPEDYDPETGEIIDAEAAAADGAEQGRSE